MKKKLLLLLAVTSTCFSLPVPERLQSQRIGNNNLLAQLMSMATPQQQYSKIPMLALNEIEQMLRKQAPTLNTVVINKVLTTLKCGQEYHVNHNEILTIIDYSLPSSEKRLWIFDLREKKLLFHTYVSHGIRSGTLLTKYFSNKNNSKASSMGVYTTNQSYYGRDGLSLRLDGLDPGFNDNASSRAIVMHGGWYMAEPFIKRYGRPGRSWGCPAVPLELTGPIINTIKNKSLFVIYYPSDNWFMKSKFLNCENFSSTQIPPVLETDTNPPENEGREGILFADMNKNSHREEHEPIVVVTADSYERLFHTKAPLERMLRRQINNVEYIALSEAEFYNIMVRNNHNFNISEKWNEIYFVVPDVQLERGYYRTHMRIVPLGKIQEVKPNTGSSGNTEEGYLIQFEARPVITLKSTSEFIRWLGL
ncbi:Uncharacterised protein [Legionella lansingensis]|uniref:Murein L,D-transpeptidase catalytic domain family protein n=1 Tax=Legionella lansingensis TaxID=45067 RepID=A0A0W0VSD1_9GAMM|nr:murein L,D-transpeptidase catalytic domain family protein [Legionella lansingensis]KTD22994.1 hypothetical protein Llan_0955 [Legionella lansingensis]SNV51278.1 Uncharacterised protein [Legionella lansingensis]